MAKERPNPDELLASVQKEEAKQKRGKLKIFLGMCPGVGKTYAMLQAARQRASEGVDVLIGVVETHGRKETEALLEGLAAASKIERPYRGTVLQEMDLDTILAIRPQLAVVDELAHTNAPGSRHPKRYQDALELLAAGIDVYTTLNVQHVESRAETVRQITGVNVQETVPDSVLDEADEVSLIDLSPDQLRQRLKEGKVYMGERAVTASENFFREENLTALREMALRLTAERVNLELREIMNEQRIPGPWKSGERLMVAIGPTPFSESLIRWTRRSAAGLNAPWIAACVETSRELDEESKKKLTRNLSLARQLGAEVVVRSGTDIAQTLIEIARQNNVTQICVGKPARISFRDWLRGGSLIQHLIQQSGDIDIHMVRIKGLGGEKKKLFRLDSAAGSLKEYGLAIAIAAIVTTGCYIAERFAGYSSVSLLYLLSVVLSGMVLSRGPVLLLGTLSALLWNFLFIPPRFTFLIYKTYDVMMFAMYFIVAIVMGQITARLRERERAERRQEERVNVLYQLTRITAMSKDAVEAIQNSRSKLEEILKVESAIFLVNEKGRPDFEKPKSGILTLSGKERSVATWAFQKQQPAGRFTETLPESEHFYLPLVSMSKTLGVLAIKPGSGQTWSLDQHSLVESFASLMTVILERDLLTKMTEEARIKNVSEKLHAALLDSVSHELKTPLTVIAGSAEHLAKGKPDPEIRQFVSEIKTASHRLLQTINGLLDMTRLDADKVQLNLEWHDMRDIMTSVRESLKEQLSHHGLQIKGLETLPLVKIDAALVKQVLMNLVSNAVTYTPENTEVQVIFRMESQKMTVSIVDRGRGIADEDMDKIFEKFYRGKQSRTGGLGLGLSIAKRFVEVHGGDMEVENVKDGGASFTFRLPVEFFDSEKMEKETS